MFVLVFETVDGTQRNKLESVFQTNLRPGGVPGHDHKTSRRHVHLVSEIIGSGNQFPLRTYRAQLAGAISVVIVKRQTWDEGSPNPDLVPAEALHDRNHWDHVSNGEKVMPACAMCVRARARCTLERVSCCMPKRAALAFRGSVGAPLKTFAPLAPFPSLTLCSGVPR